MMIRVIRPWRLLPSFVALMLAGGAGRTMAIPLMAVGQVRDCVPDLRLTTVTEPELIDRETDVTFALTVTNAGKYAALRVRLEDTPPKGSTFVKVGTTRGQCTNPSADSGNSFVCQLGDLRPGDEATVTLVVRIRPEKNANADNAAKVIAEDSECRE